MPRLQRSYCSPADLELICPVNGCRKKCRTYGGLAQHIQAKHKDYQPGTPFAAVVNDFNILDSDLSSANDLEISFPLESDPDGPWDAFNFDSESNHNSIDFDFENPFLPSSRPDSPSRESEASNVVYHPIING